MCLFFGCRGALKLFYVKEKYKEAYFGTVSGRGDSLTGEGRNWKRVKSKIVKRGWEYEAEKDKKGGKKMKMTRSFSHFNSLP